MSDETAHLSVGMLSVGEMGAAFGEALTRRGFRIRTALVGRSLETRERARRAGIEDVGDVEHLVNTVDCLLCFVPPETAGQVAAEVADAVAPSRRLVYADFNSIGPDEAQDLAVRLAGKGIDYVDGSIHGQARHLTTSSRVYLSGSRAGELAKLLGAVLPVRELGREVAAASLFKLLLAALSKTMVSHFLQAGLFARETAQLPLFMEQVRHFYPGLLEAVERMAPTYPRHAQRRSREMENVSRAMASHGLRPGLAEETRRFLADLATAALPPGPPSGGAWGLEQLIEEMGRAGVLRGPQMHGA